jgi:hypothetical protein
MARREMYEGIDFSNMSSTEIDQLYAQAKKRSVGQPLRGTLPQRPSTLPRLDSEAQNRAEQENLDELYRIMGRVVASNVM